MKSRFHTIKLMKNMIECACAHSAKMDIAWGVHVNNACTDSVPSTCILLYCTQKCLRAECVIYQHTKFTSKETKTSTQSIVPTSSSQASS